MYQVHSPSAGLSSAHRSRERAVATRTRWSRAASVARAQYHRFPSCPSLACIDLPSTSHRHGAVGPSPDLNDARRNIRWSTHVSSIGECHQHVVAGLLRGRWIG
ncbi:hypothetical protein BD309DRAFT_157142 [Dichomitus squalens]|nr:hypothetical protein BD309DRAFT_157142 [Dichomitus squalens]